jgi:CO/xanthine dehydrogenase FAD-binding subunit
MDTFRPTDLREALRIREDRRAVPFAGGTDLMVKLRRGAGALPAFDRPVLFLDRVEELQRIRLTDGFLEIGSTVTLAGLAGSDLVPSLLRQIALQVGAPALRNVATLGGNICNASPAGDTLPFLYACEARLRLVSVIGERVVPVEQFITGPGTTCLRADEILSAVLLMDGKPKLSFWRKVGARKANALSKVSLAGLSEGCLGGGISSTRIALGAVAPTVVRLRAVERMLHGAVVEDLEREDFLTRARFLCGEAVYPIDDQRSTAEYRGRVAANLVELFLKHLFEFCSVKVWNSNSCGIY